MQLYMIHAEGWPRSTCLACTCNYTGYRQQAARGAKATVYKWHTPVKSMPAEVEQQEAAPVGT